MPTVRCRGSSGSQKSVGTGFCGHPGHSCEREVCRVQDPVDDRVSVCGPEEPVVGRGGGREGRLRGGAQKHPRPPPPTKPHPKTPPPGRSETNERKKTPAAPE